ncbi:MAG: hypothetical protein CMJ83_03630 [Planctomycetes bacterium]|nr:hypothetical protein [Planctomycetota bacterium]
MKIMLNTLVALAVLGGALAAQNAKNIAVSFTVEGKSVEVVLVDGTCRVLVDKKEQPVDLTAANITVTAADGVELGMVDLTVTADEYEPEKPRRRVVGIRVKEPEAALAKHSGVKGEDAMVVVHVRENGPAAKAGIELYDVITRVQGQTPATLPRLRSSLEKLEAGDPIVLDVVRAGRARTIRITCEAEPDSIVAIDNVAAFNLNVVPRFVADSIILSANLEQSFPRSAIVEFPPANQFKAALVTNAIRPTVTAIARDSAISTGGGAAAADVAARLARIEKLLEKLLADREVTKKNGK